MDHRDVVNTDYRPYQVDVTLKTISLDSDDGVFEVPMEWGVCPTCQGEGKHVNPSIDAHGLSAEDFAEDPEFAEDYMRGTYDVPCHECQGQRVVPTSTDPRFIKAMDEFWASEAADRHTQMMESGGCGY